MNLGEELERLDQLRQRGVLSEAEFTQAKSRLFGHLDRPVLSAVNALRRSRSDRWVAGLCGGVARATGTDAWVWRLLFALFFFFGGAGLLIYVLMWIFVPLE